MAETIHGVVRTDKMYGTDVGVNLVSAKYLGSGTTETDVDNGNVLKVGELISYTQNNVVVGYEREVRKATTPAANTPLNEIILVATPEVMYDERLKNLHNFYNEAGKILRGFFLHEHDYFGVTKEALNTADNFTITVGNVVELMAGTKLNVVASATANSTVVGKIAAIETVGRYTYYVVEVA